MMTIECSSLLSLTVGGVPQVYIATVLLYHKLHNKAKVLE